jgi:hypothetical protein
MYCTGGALKKSAFTVSKVIKPKTFKFFIIAKRFELRPRV